VLALYERHLQMHRPQPGTLHPGLGSQRSSHVLAEESYIDGLRAGADDYLAKPFSARELAARIESQLSLARLRRHAADLERKLRTKSAAELSALAKLK
jgi:CheY-like chemotaxis protein